MSTYFKDMLERALSTAAQAEIALLGGDAMGFFSNTWQLQLSTVVGAAALSILKAIAARGTGNPQDASLVK